MKVLLIEDNASIVSGLTYSLEQSGFEVVSASTTREARASLKSFYDIIILDISLPDGSGLDFFASDIGKTGIPVIFLTAKDDEATIVKSLTLGAEDYITKPFSTNVLIARMEKILNRRDAHALVKVQDISFDLDKMEVYKDDHKIELSSLELKILHLLFTTLDKVVRRDVIIDKIWEWTGNDVNDNTVTVYLKRIREKLGTDIIITNKGIGYRIDRDAQ